MRLALIMSLAFILASSNIFGQTRMITGKVINENLEAISEVRIKNSDTVLLGKTDTEGKFTIEIPTTTKTLLFSWIGYEWKSIKLSANCDTLEIILMYNAIYDYISLKKIDKLRMKRFEKLPELYSEAYKRGIFINQLPCYEQKFNPIGKK
jgi:hypothetical protein